MHAKVTLPKKRHLLSIIPHFREKKQTMTEVALLTASPRLALGSVDPSACATAGWGSLSDPEYLSQPVDMLRGC